MTFGSDRSFPAVLKKRDLAESCFPVNQTLVVAGKTRQGCCCLTSVKVSVTALHNKGFYKEFRISKGSIGS